MKTIAILIAAASLVSCATDPGHTSRDSSCGSMTPGDAAVLPPGDELVPAHPSPSPRFTDPGITRLFPSDRRFIPGFGSGGSGGSGSAPAFHSDPIITRLDRGSALRDAISPAPARFAPPESIIPSMPSPRPSESTRTIRVPSRVTGTTPALRLDRSALTR